MSILIGCPDCKELGMHDLMVDGGMQTVPCPMVDKVLLFLEDVIAKRGPFKVDQIEFAYSVLTDHSERAKEIRDGIKS